MYKAQAKLIQDVGGFLAELQPQFGKIVERYKDKGLTQSSFLRWIITEELEVVYGLFDAMHAHSIISFEQPYNELKFMLPFQLSMCFSHYIKAPKIYPDNNLVNVMMLPNNSFCICYTANLNKYEYQHDR